MRSRLVVPLGFRRRAGYELVIKSQGGQDALVTVPAPLLATADEVIE